MPTHRFPCLERSAVYPELYGSDGYAQATRRFRRGAAGERLVLFAVIRRFFHFQLSCIYQFFHIIMIFHF
jgi:hypothetical protein